MINVSYLMLGLAGGFWFFLLVGCFVFGFLTLQQRRRAEFSELSVRELLTDLAITRGDLEALRANQQSRDEGLSRSDANFEALQEKFADLEKNYNQLLEIKVLTEQDLSAAAGQNAENQGAIEALQRERDMLERQLQNLSLSADAGTKETMREMIVNFTEESRELLLAIEESAKEKAELQQKITDMEKSGKGTAGAVVGLKRRLAEAEAALQELGEIAR
ncbi:hypothetical protein OAG89_03350 [Pseudomonadales bacterium]|nr:hypothetical protein [Pseudomonadales bacterium]MDB4528938.1 hypothetical protein [Pseudomonadales bacterium]MDB4807001.1 hypothetical protein [Pseudomonadales bacterium]